MFATRNLCSFLLLSALAVACTVGDAATPQYVDSNGDGVSDSVDTNGDGSPDFHIPSCPTCQPGGGLVCSQPLIDLDGDGLPDGIDLDCDGVIDIPIDLGGGGGSGGSTGHQSCVSTVMNNGDKKQISCNADNGGPYTCECRIDDQLVTTCTTSSTSACSIGGTQSNCCGSRRATTSTPRPAPRSSTRPISR